MLQRICASVLLILTCTMYSFASVNTNPANGEKGISTTQQAKQAQPSMKFISCGQKECGFWAKSHSKKELRYIMKHHAKKYHKTALTKKQLSEMIKKQESK
jgi:predicted small metal-binding protein